MTSSLQGDLTDQHLDTDQSLRQWIRGLPKAEVHVHLEGCIPPPLLNRAATRAGVDIPKGGPFDGLADMLSSLDASCYLLSEPDDIIDLAHAYGRSTIANGVLYSDVIVNPGHWPAWKPRLAQFVSLLDRGFAAAEEEGAAPVGLCLSISRWMSASEAGEIVDTIEQLRHPRLVGLSLDGNEAAPGAGTDRFAPTIARARNLGLGIAVHAGESSGPDGVRHAIEVLHPDRIDHGIRAVRDTDLLRDLAVSATPLDVCPSSNIQLNLVANINKHPVDRLIRAGVRVTLNTDDPILFDTTLVDEYTQTMNAFGWDHHTVADLAKTSIEASFATPEHKDDLLAHLEAYLRTNP